MPRNNQLTLEGESMKPVLTLIAVSAICLNFTSAFAGDAAAGKSKAATCGACHGMNGISPNDLWPNLAGQKEGYLVAQMKGFRDGQRANPMMAPMAAALSDTDIADLAAYYSSLGK
jgi:cytochrome c553